MSSMSRRSKILLAFVLVMIILTIPLGFISYIILSNPSVEVGLIEVDIDGEEAHVTAHLDMKPKFDISGSELWMEFRNYSFEMDIEDHSLSTVLTNVQFKNLMDAGYANITGEVVVDGIITIRKDIGERIDLTFLSELGETIDVKSVKSHFVSLETVTANITFTAEIERELLIRAYDTNANVTTSSGTYGCRVRDLLLTSDGVGTGELVMPMAAVLSVALINSTMTVDLWGIIISMEYPINV